MTQNQATKQKLLFVIGIDPGVATGYGEYNVDLDKLVVCKTLDFWTVYKDMMLYSQVADPKHILIVIEDASLNKPTFRQKGEGKYQDRLSRNVGGVQRESQLLADGLERLGYVVQRVKPTQAKWTVEEFKRITGHAGRTSQHARDAARLCFGIRNWPIGMRA